MSIDDITANGLDRSEQTRLVDDILAAVTERIEQRRFPTATYRVQFHAGCRLREVTPLVPYLHALGISDLYASPLLTARPGSQHGYDIVNHAALNPEIGTLDDLQDLAQALKSHGMGLIADVVPNHMAADPERNAWWHDVLENGPSSAFAAYFDIDWKPLKPDLANKVLLPVLGDQFGRVLEDGGLVLQFHDGAFRLAVGDQHYPIAPDTYARILSPRLEELQQRLGAEQPDVQELYSILTAIRNLPGQTETAPERQAERRREKEIIKRRLHELAAQSPGVAEFIADNVRDINGRPGDPQSFNQLEELLQEQPYRLSYWRVAADEINYRRFFDINGLAAVCTESPAVFADMHRLLFEWLDAGWITGLRIDHPDGLYDPRGYFRQLQETHFLRLVREELLNRPGDESPEQRADLEQQLLALWRPALEIPGSALAQPLFVVVEKILAADERLPDDWPVHGTVGYEFLNAVNGLFVDPAGERPLSSLFERFTGESGNFGELAYECKRLIVRMSMVSELNVLGDRLDRLSERNRHTRDLTLSSLRLALREVVAGFRVYRTYVQPDRILERDARYVEAAVAFAKRRNPAMSGVIFDFVRDVLLLRAWTDEEETVQQAMAQFVGKFQQLTGPIMAKAIEDTALYRFTRLISLNEVGGEPATFGTPAATLHAFNQSRLPRYAHSLNASSTHDTKRSEDVRARISVLSEIPREWRDRIRAWSRAHRRLKTEVDGVEAPSRNSEYLLYQTLIGVWPDRFPTGTDRQALIDRLQEHLLKVEREAKSHTSWVSPNEAYEEAVTRFVAGVFADRRSAVLEDIHQFACRVADHGRWNSLSQLLLKIASPGIPDFFQGMELWRQTLVDPDNRRPVDFGALEQTFAELRRHHTTDHGTIAARWLEARADGRIKLFLTMAGLHARQRYPELFAAGQYVPLELRGRFAECAFAFARQADNKWAVVIAPRLTVRVVGFGGPPPLGEVWEDTAVVLPQDLPAVSVSNLLAQETIKLRSGERDDERLLPLRQAFRLLPWWLSLNEPSESAWDSPAKTGTGRSSLTLLVRHSPDTGEREIQRPEGRPNSPS